MLIRRYKTIFLLYSILIIFAICQVQPTWSKSDILSSGQHKAVNYATTAPSTFTVAQSFNQVFASGVIPFVVLSLQALQQSQPSSGSSDVGWKVQVTSANANDFYNEVTIYGASITVLYFLYMGVDPAATEFYTQYDCLQFSSGNLYDSSSSSRVYTQTRTLTNSYNFVNYMTNQIKYIVYLGGYKTQMGTTGLDLKIRSTVVSSNSYQLQIQTGGDAIFSQITFFIIAFDKDQIQGPPYTRVFDLGAYQGFNNVQDSISSSLTEDQFQYRNFMMGYTEFELTNAISNQINQRIYLSPIQTFYTCYYPNPTTYQYLYAYIFHHRVRQCPSSEPYYVLDEKKCYDVCPSRFNKIDSNGNYCYYQYIVVCGDGLYQSSVQQCDDGNTDNQDGCSSICKIESSHLCSQTVFNNGTSLCSYSQKMNLTILQIKKIITSNQLSILMQIEALQCNNIKLRQFFQQLQAIQIYTLGQSRRMLYNDQSSKQQVKASSSTLNISSIAYTELQNGAQVDIRIGYSSYISLAELQSKSLKFVPSSLQTTRYFHLTPESTVSQSPYQTYTTLVPFNAASLNYYNNYQYEVYDAISIISLVILCIAYLFLLITLIVDHKYTVVPVQYLLLYQIICFAITGQEQIELGFLSLLTFARFSAFGGGNIQIITADGIYVYGCKTGQALNIYCIGVNDVNIPVWIGIILLMVGIALKYWWQKKQDQLDEMSSQQSQRVRQEQESDSRNKNIVFKSDRKIFKPSAKIQNMVEIIWELIFAIFFLMAIFTIITQITSLMRTVTTDQILISGIINLLIYCIAAIFLWAYWFIKYYQLLEISYVKISRVSLAKISLLKFHYFIYFWMVIIWAILNTLVGPGTESFIIILSLIWIIMIIKSNIYQNKFHKIRSFINHAVLIIVMIFYLVANFSQIDNLTDNNQQFSLSSSFIFSIIIVTLLLTTLLINIFVLIFVAIRNRSQKLPTEFQYTDNNSMLEQIYGSVKKNSQNRDDTRIITPSNRNKNFEQNNETALKQLMHLRQLKQELKISYQPSIYSAVQTPKKGTFKKQAIIEIMSNNNERIMATARGEDLDVQDKCNDTSSRYNQI